MASYIYLYIFLGAVVCRTRSLMILNGSLTTQDICFIYIYIYNLYEYLLLKLGQSLFARAFPAEEELPVSSLGEELLFSAID